MKKVPKKHIGERIKRMRGFQGLTQEDLAKAIGRTRSLISSLERTGKGSPYTMQKIADVLQTTIAALEEGAEQNLQIVKDPELPYRTVTEAEKMIIQMQKEINFLKETNAKLWQLIFKNDKPAETKGGDEGL